MLGPRFEFEKFVKIQEDLNDCRFLLLKRVLSKPLSELFSNLDSFISSGGGEFIKETVRDRFDNLEDEDTGNEIALRHCDDFTAILRYIMGNFQYEVLRKFCEQDPDWSPEERV